MFFFVLPQNAWQVQCEAHLEHLLHSTSQPCAGEVLLLLDKKAGENKEEYLWHVLPASYSWAASTCACLQRVPPAALPFPGGVVAGCREMLKEKEGVV